MMLIESIDGGGYYLKGLSSREETVTVLAGYSVARLRRAGIWLAIEHGCV